MQDKSLEFRRGVTYVGTALCLWGVLPIYWKSMDSVLPYEILCERILWACVSMFVWIIFTGRWTSFYQECRMIFADRKQTLLLIAAGICISLNWCMFIVAVNSGKIMQASLGYYINPLVSIMFGVYYFKEKLSLGTKISFVLAAIGVLTMIFRVGEIPWVSFGLALSFAIYSLLKKLVTTTVVTGLTLETLIVLPIALGYIGYMYNQGVSAWQVADTSVLGLLVSSGVITAIPLLLFSAGARMVPLNVVGFMQYISPTISLVIGIFIYGEVFTFNHFLSFGFIWLGLAIFTLAQNGQFNVALEKIFMKKQLPEE